MYVARTILYHMRIYTLVYTYGSSLGPSQVNLVYVIWKQTDFALDLWFEKLIFDLKTWFVIWKLISEYL